MNKGRPIIPDNFIKDFCRKRHIKKLSVFGSHLREDFGPESDIDFLVEFDPEHIPGLLEIAGMEIELSETLGRKVDLRMLRTSADISATRLLHMPRCSMRIDDLIRLRHMLDAGQKAVSFVANKNRADLDDDPTLAFALMKAIEIIGEAASKVSRSSQERFKEIPWSQIVGMRNRLIHA